MSRERSFLIALSFRSEGTEGLESAKKTDLYVLTDEVRAEWRLLWRDRIDDKVRAEGIANRDYSLLSVERGTVILATRDFKPLDLKRILHSHQIRIVEQFVPPHPSVGGWRKFARTVLSRQRRAQKSSGSPPDRNREKNLPLKKGGRGWLHRHMMT